MSHLQGPSDHEVETTAGPPAVDDALARLDALDDLPVAEHAAVFEEVHQSLRRSLRGDETDGTH